MTHDANDHDASAAAADLGDARILLPERIERGSVIHVRALLSHPMHTGLFRTAKGEPIPSHFVKTVVVTYGGEEVATFEWTSGVSRDPYVAFPLRATREAPLAITWTDNRGGVFKQAADVKFG
jgi:sulfur-oxidizing protein SoxZ